MKSVELSIIVPVYNVEKYVKQCIDSLINQKENNYEIIIVNDGSTDKSLEICNEYSDNKKVKIYTKKNGGLSNARNYGIDKANGKYITFVDSDDWVTDNYVEEIVLAINKNPDCDLITYDMISINDGWKDGIIRKIYDDFDEMDKHSMMRSSLNPSFACARAYKKELIKKIKFPTENYWYEDMATIPIVISKSNSIKYIAKPLYYYRQRNSSITSARMNPKSLDLVKSLEISLAGIDREYKDDFIYAMYYSLVNFMYFKPEYADKYLQFYQKHKRKFEKNEFIQRDIKAKKIEDISEKKLIPKKIHYFWFGNGEKSALFTKCFESWKKYAPDFEIIEWNETNCDINECQYVKEAYENKKWAFVTDYFRLKVIKENGGIYVDTDTELTSYVHGLLLNQAFFAFETNNVHAGIFGAIPNFDIINAIFESYKDDKFVNDDGTLNTSNTIPKRISDILKRETSIKMDGTEQLLEKDIKIYSADVLTLNMYNDKNIAEHHYEATWWDAKYGIRSYKYNVLQWYFHNVDREGLPTGIRHNLKSIFRNIVPYKIRKTLKKIVKR